MINESELLSHLQDRASINEKSSSEWGAKTEQGLVHSGASNEDLTIIDWIYRHRTPELQIKQANK